MKKISLLMILPVMLCMPGCSWFKPHKKTVAPVTAQTAIVTPDLSLAAKVISVNTVGRFVVLDFSAGQMPKVQQTLSLYRAGLKVAEVKITWPQSDNNIVADLVSGDAKGGD